MPTVPRMTKFNVIVLLCTVAVLQYVLTWLLLPYDQCTNLEPLENRPDSVEQWPTMVSM